MQCFSPACFTRLLAPSLIPSGRSCLLELPEDLQTLQVMMVTEYMQGGDLGTALVGDNPTNRRLGWYNNGIHIALSAARGLAYLHAQKVTISLPVCPGSGSDAGMRHYTTTYQAWTLIL